MFFFVISLIDFYSVGSMGDVATTNSNHYTEVHSYLPYHSRHSFMYSLHLGSVYLCPFASTTTEISIAKTAL